MTGSTTSEGSWPAAARRATTSMVAAETSMPVLVAATGRSARTAAIWASTSSAGTGWTATTSAVFWAVTAVTAVVASTPRALMALRSAWMPAPAPESDPAMVRATGGPARPVTARCARRPARRPRRGTAG